MVWQLTYVFEIWQCWYLICVVELALWDLKNAASSRLEKKNSNNLRKMFLFSAARSKKPPTERYRHISSRLQPYTYRRYDRLNTNFLSVPVGFCDRGMRRYCRFCDTEKTPRVCFFCHGRTQGLRYHLAGSENFRWGMTKLPSEVRTGLQAGI